MGFRGKQKGEIFLFCRVLREGLISGVSRRCNRGRKTPGFHHRALIENERKNPGFWGRSAISGTPIIL